MPIIEDIDPPPGMKVRFISDLHYGHERSQAPLPQDLGDLLQGIGMLVIVGDLAETRPCPWQQKGLSLRQELREACQQAGVRLIEISGNHDPDIEPLLIRFWGGKVIAMHGHALYKEGAPWSWEYLHFKKKCQELMQRHPLSDTCLNDRLELSRAMCQLTPPIMKRRPCRIACLNSLLHCFWPPKRPLMILWGWLSCGRKAEAFARQFFPQAETVVMGHFHRSGHWRYGKRHIYNTGAWFTHATPYVLDMQDAHLLSYKKFSRITT